MTTAPVLSHGPELFTLEHGGTRTRTRTPEFFIRSQAGYVYSVVANSTLGPLSGLAAKVKT